MGQWAIAPPVTPTEAKVRTDFPTQPGWAYEPKWDGFRAVAWCGQDPRLDSRNHRPLLRYFPELTEPLASLDEGAVLDGEVVVVVDDVTSFDTLQLRIHPAESRIKRLAHETPAELVVFDLLALGSEDLRERPFLERRKMLHRLMQGTSPPWHVTPTTDDVQEARAWYDVYSQAGCDGIVAKRLDLAYREGKRDMVKIKQRHTADTVVGGYRVHTEGGKVGSLLLGLYDAEHNLHFVGHCSGFSEDDRIRLFELLQTLEAEASFGDEARKPGAPSRWSGGKDVSFVAVEPKIVAEVSYDQITAGRFRHATRFERWRPDKDPEQCTLDQIGRPRGVGFSEVVS